MDYIIVVHIRLSGNLPLTLSFPQCGILQVVCICPCYVLHLLPVETAHCWEFRIKFPAALRGCLRGNENKNIFSSEILSQRYYCYSQYKNR